MHQQNDPDSKIVAGLERISEAFRVLLWEHAKSTGLSPIQIQILIFIKYHEQKLCNVSHLAQEFNMTKATISDAIKVLHRKELIEKHPSVEDRRAYTIALTEEGKKIITQAEQFAQPIRAALDTIDANEKASFLKNLSQLIFQLNRSDILQIQRTCYLCRFYKKNQEGHFCQYLQKALSDQELRLDCPEFEGK